MKLTASQLDLLAVVAVHGYYVDEDNFLDAAEVRRGFARVESDPDMLALNATQLGVDEAIRLGIARLNMGHIERVRQAA